MRGIDNFGVLCYLEAYSYMKTLVTQLSLNDVYLQIDSVNRSHQISRGKSIEKHIENNFAANSFGIMSLLELNWSFTLIHCRQAKHANK